MVLALFGHLPVSPFNSPNKTNNLDAKYNQWCSEMQRFFAKKGKNVPASDRRLWNFNYATSDERGRKTTGSSNLGELLSNHELENLIDPIRSNPGVMEIK
jgi:hypothetical protein